MKKNILSLLLVVLCLVSLSACKGNGIGKSCRCEYEVVSVFKYIRNDTNTFGGITGTTTCYSFQYLDKNTLKTVDNFEDLEYGLTHVTIGDKISILKCMGFLILIAIFNLRKKLLQICKFHNQNKYINFVVKPLRKGYRR